MSNVSNRDKQTAQMHGIQPSTARSIKAMLSKARNEVEAGLVKPRGFKRADGSYDESDTREKRIEQLQKFFFGTLDEFPYTQTETQLRELKRWVEAVAADYFMLHAISLYETCYLAQFNHSNRVGVVQELAARCKRFNIMLRVINDCIMNKTSLRRFTAHEQNDFLHR